MVFKLVFFISPTHHLIKFSGLFLGRQRLSPYLSVHRRPIDREESRRDLSLPMESYPSIDLHRVRYFFRYTEDRFDSSRCLNIYYISIDDNQPWYFRGELNITIFEKINALIINFQTPYFFISLWKFDQVACDIYHYGRIIRRINELNKHKMQRLL